MATPVGVLRRDIARGETITATDVEVTSRWLAPAVARQVFPPGAVTGHLARTRLHAGALLHRDNLQAPAMVHRGDRVNVRCLVGGVVISLQAEARADGTAGEMIELCKLGERTTFLATVSGPGEVVVDLAR